MPHRAWYPSPEELGPRLLKKSAVQAAIAAGEWGIAWWGIGVGGASGSDRFSGIGVWGIGVCGASWGILWGIGVRPI